MLAMTIEEITIPRPGISQKKETNEFNLPVSQKKETDELNLPGPEESSEQSEKERLACSKLSSVDSGLRIILGDNNRPESLDYSLETKYQNGKTQEESDRIGGELGETVWKLEAKSNDSDSSEENGMNFVSSFVNKQC